MTVCVGAIASFNGRNIVVGASDRMVTAGDIEFEQEQRKILVLTSSVTIMVSGDLTIPADILHQLMALKEEELEAHPERWLNVKKVADWFHQELAAITKRRAVQTILFPLDLTFERLTAATFPSELQNQLLKELLEFRISPIQAVVMGMDETGAHIYEVNNQGVSCQDWTGFASIGAGAWHANSQLMFGEHVKTKEMAESLMLVYTAKKRAEVAPGVGEKTDMIVIGPGLGVFAHVGDPIMGEIENTYKRVQKQAQKVRANGNAKITKFVETTLRDTAPESPAEQATELATQSSTEENGKPEKATGEEAS